MNSSDALSEVVLNKATCEWGIAADCLTVRVPAGLVAKAGHVPPNGGTTSEEKASIPVSKQGDDCGPIVDVALLSKFC